VVKQAAVCNIVINGDTFYTDRNVRIRLARVKAPLVNTPEGQIAKRMLSSLVLANAITYKPVAADTYGRSVAEVWIDSANVNDLMIFYGYR